MDQFRFGRSLGRYPSQRSQAWHRLVRSYRRWSDLHQSGVARHNAPMKSFKYGATPGPFLASVAMDPRYVDPDHYAFQLPAMRGFTSLDLHPAVTFFVGENGSGKSTLLEAMAIANGLNPEGGSRNMLFNTRDSHSKLHQALVFKKLHNLVPDAWFLRAESLFNVATEIENLDQTESDARKVIDSYGGTSLHEQSHGEAFMSLIENRFGQGLYFLDEPEAALSPQRQLEFLVLLHGLVEQHSQLVIATHSPIIMSYPNAQIYSFADHGIAPVDYEDTEHYRITKMFLDGPRRMLKHLLDVVIGNFSETALMGFLGAAILWAVGLLSDQIARVALRSESS